MIAFAARLAPHHKLDGARPAPLLRAALDELLPRRRAPRAPAAAPPLEQWLEAEPRIRQLVGDSLSALKRRRIVRADFIDSLMPAAGHGRQAPHGQMAWLLTMLEQWLSERRAATVRLAPPRRVAHEPEACRQ